jgi:hypothetical protein
MYLFRTYKYKWPLLFVNIIPDVLESFFYHIDVLISPAVVGTVSYLMPYSGDFFSFGSAVDVCEHGNESSSSTKVENFLDS